ncbi:hypothetical protein DFH08DRAFT_928135 [Mycena albidolilacea]|uniref:Uncharacterized protein n=1 Tax=Mycena albidolilacea TaxID=1033008 RepID=A0AAD7ATN1_9AGAR|nr:hypothetical protein DFH08DRAFT_928135 [Mycena albidolilacea]
MPPQKRKEGDSGLDPVIDKKGRVESTRQRSRASSAKYCATQPEVRERRRIQTAQRRAAKKAHKRQWDPPKKTRNDTQDEAAASGSVLATESSQAPAASPEVHSTQDELVDSDVAFHTAAPAETPSQSSMGRPKRKIQHKLGGSDAVSYTAAPAQNLSQPSIGRPKRKSEVYRIQEESLDDDVSDPDVGEDSTRASTPEDEEYHPSLERAERQRGQHRKAVAKYYASRPEVREKREIQAVERRAAKKAHWRQRDPPKKPKSSTHVVSSSAPPTEVSHASTTGLHDIRHELPDSDIDNASTAAPAQDLSQSPTSRPKRKVLRAPAPTEELSQSSTGRPKRKLKVHQMQEQGKPDDVMDLDVASGGNGYDPGPELERGEQAKAQRRRSSRKYYARYTVSCRRIRVRFDGYFSHPEVREKKRVYMAEKRAAIKARRRQWDPPKKPKSSTHVAPSSAPPTKVAHASTAGLDDMQPELADSNHTASTAAPAENLSQSATDRPKRKLKVHQMQEQAFYDSDVASDAHHATDLPVAPGYGPGAELEWYVLTKSVNQTASAEQFSVEQTRLAQRRKSSRKYYASHPEVRERKRVYMAQKRAAIKARRRQWDPPKKPKATTQAGPPISSAAAGYSSGMTQVGSSGERDWELMSHEGSDAEDVVVGGNTALTGVYCWNV